MTAHGHPVHEMPPAPCAAALAWHAARGTDAATKLHRNVRGMTHLDTAECSEYEKERGGKVYQVKQEVRLSVLLRHNNHIGGADH